MFSQPTFRIIPYFLSQYLIFLIIVIIFTVPNQSTKTYIADPRFSSSSNGENWSDSYDPDYFFHLTDIHVTHYIKSTLRNFEQSLQIASFLKPKVVLITGDLVDNYDLPYFPDRITETKQIEEDWLDYYQIAQKYQKNFEKIIESFGNHDIPRILSKESNNFFYKNYSIISQSHHQFSMPNDTYDIFTEKSGNFTFAVLNPVFFPIPPLPFDYYIHAPSEYIEKVESVISTIPSTENVIVATHYQGPVWSRWYVPFEKSATTERFFGSILQEKKVKILLTGHNHGEGRMVMHHGDSFEVCASDLRYNLKCGVVTNDNRNVVYHWFSINKPTLSFVTFPCPIDQTTSRTDSTVPKIRVISFMDNLSDIFVSVDDKKIKLSPVRPLENNKDAWILEADMFNLSHGKHKLKLIGEDEEEFEFLHGPSEKIVAKKELLYDDMLWAQTQWIGLIILIMISVFVTFPFSICICCSYTGYWKWMNMESDYEKSTKLKKEDKNKKAQKKEKNNATENIVHRYSKEIKGKDNNVDDENNENDTKEDKFNNVDLKYWLISIFVGPVAIRSRILHLPIFLRILLFISVLVSPFLPLFTFEVGDRYGFMFPFGFFLGLGNGEKQIKGGNYISRVYGTFELRYEEWCPFIGFLFFVCAVVPNVLMASSFGLIPDNRKDSFWQILDIFAQIGGFIGALLLAFRSFMLLCERKCAFMSPFVLFPLFWMSILSVYFYIRRMRK